MESSKFKLLDNYQLYQLLKNDSIDTITRAKLKTEFDERDLSANEKNRIQNKYQLNFSSLEAEIDKSNWNPLFTAFALNKHFNHLALLKVHGRKKEAKKYILRFYLGLAIYLALFLAVLFILK